MKSASRLAYHIMEMDRDQVVRFANVLLHAKEAIRHCACCETFTDGEFCSICADPARDKGVICVVEAPKDITAFERMNEYHGSYHVLHGLISPMHGVYPDDLRIRSLLARVQAGGVREIIMATNPTVEGDTTATYLSQLLKPLGIEVTRLAFGLPVGGVLEYADEVTLYKALENRSKM